MIGASNILKAFERNCPCVRMTGEEREELRRLIWEAQKDAADEGRREAQTAVTMRAK